MSIFDDLKEDSAKIPLFNTGTMYDVMTGSYSRGKDGKWYLSGGIPAAITGLHGGGNLFKSTMMDSFVVGALKIYPETDMFVFDTEGSKNPERIAAFMADPLHEELHSSMKDVESHITIKSGPDDVSIEPFWDFMKGICARKEANKKSQTVTIPILDVRTGKPIQTWIPTFVFLDSLTELESNEEAEMLDSKKGIEDKKNKTIWLLDGNKKTILTRAMRKMAARYGICFICSAHKGSNSSMDSYAPASKQLQHMKQADRMKGVGSRFEFLTHVLSQVIGAKVLPDSSGNNSLYGPGPIEDINEILLKIQRNKSNASGVTSSFIVSQEEGMLNIVSYLHYLRSNNYVGLDGGPSKPKHACVLNPDTKFSRNTIREQSSTDYALCRAIELTARYRYIQDHWNLSKIPFDFTKTPEQLFDALTANKAEMKDILETTSYWTITKSDREYMSIMDVLERANLPAEKTVSTGKKGK